MSGIDSIAELEGNLSDVSAPLNLTTSISLEENETVTIGSLVGCFIGGAGNKLYAHNSEWC